MQKIPFEFNLFYFNIVSYENFDKLDLVIKFFFFQFSEGDEANLCAVETKGVAWRN